MGQPAADLPRQQVRDFGVGRDGFQVTGLWILPKGMFFTLAAQHAPVTPEVPEKSLALHPTTTGSCLASGGKARSDSSRRCARMSAIASRKFARHSSCVVPWPFAPGTSAQYATNQGPSLSRIAVNSFRIDGILPERKGRNCSTFFRPSFYLAVKRPKRPKFTAPPKRCLRPGCRWGSPRSA